MKLHKRLTIIMMICVAVLLCFLAAATQLDLTQIARLSYNASQGAMQVQIVAQAGTSPQTTNTYDQTQIANLAYDETLGAIQVVVDNTDGSLPFLNVSGLSDGDYIYYNATTEQFDPIDPQDIPFYNASGLVDNNYLYWDAASSTWKNRKWGWEDLRVPLTSTRVGAARAPGFSQVLDNGASSTGVYTYVFDKATEEEVFFNAQLPHAWEEGTDLEPHIHWFPIDTDVGFVRWGLECSWANTGAVYGNTSIIYANSSTTGSANESLYADFAMLDGTGKTISSMLLCRIFRDAGNDDYDNDAAALEIDFHYLQDSSGSQEEVTK